LRIPAWVLNGDGQRAKGQTKKIAVYKHSGMQHTGACRMVLQGLSGNVEVFKHAS
jgi:hypothetical protein